MQIVNLGKDTSICGGNVLLNAGNPGSTYQWNTGQQSQSIVVNNTNTHIVTVTNSMGCSGTDTIHVNVFTPPIVNLGNDIILPDPPAILDAGSGFVSYLWSNNQTSQSISVTMNGTYTVTVTDANGCSASDEIQVNFTSGFTAYDQTPMEIIYYPNPTRDRINVRITENRSNELQVAIMDVQGKILQMENLYDVEESFSFE